MKATLAKVVVIVQLAGQDDSKSVHSGAWFIGQVLCHQAMTWRREYRTYSASRGNVCQI